MTNHLDKDRVQTDRTKEPDRSGGQLHAPQLVQVSYHGQDRLETVPGQIRPEGRCRILQVKVQSTSALSRLQSNPMGVGK